MVYHTTQIIINTTTTRFSLSLISSTLFPDLDIRIVEYIYSIYKHEMNGFGILLLSLSYCYYKYRS